MLAQIEKALDKALYAMVILSLLGLWKLFELNLWLWEHARQWLHTHAL